MKAKHGGVCVFVCLCVCMWGRVRVRVSLCASTNLVCVCVWCWECVIMGRLWEKRTAWAAFDGIKHSITQLNPPHPLPTAPTLRFKHFTHMHAHSSTNTFVRTQIHRQQEAFPLLQLNTWSMHTSHNDSLSLSYPNHRPIWKSVHLSHLWCIKHFPVTVIMGY